MPRHAARYRLRPRGPFLWVYFRRNKKDHFLSTECARGERQRAVAEAERIVLEHDTKARPCSLCAGGGADPAPGVSLKQLSEAYVKSLRRTHSEQYVKRAVTDMVHYIEKRWQHPAEITSKAWESAVVDWHSTPTKRKARLSYGSIANLGNTLRAFLRYCKDAGAIDSVPEIKSPTEKQKRKDRPQLRAMDEDQREAFLWALALAEEWRALLVYTTLFETWMRKGALMAMTRRWINFRQEEITIPAAYTKSQKEDKVIDMTPRAAEAIRAAEADPPELDAPIFGRFDFHQDWRTRGGGVFGKALLAAGIDRQGFTPHHMTRRTAATIASEKPGASLGALMAQGAWDSASVPERYMKPTLHAARRVTRR